MTFSTDAIILIPAYNPDEKLVRVIKDIIAKRFSKIIVVNDGSSKESNAIFETISKLDPVTVVDHPVNQGKGRALKTGLSFILKQFNENTGVVTVDADGQHDVEDILKVAEKLYKHPNGLVLGVRDFSKENIPLRSRFGNNLTRLVVRFSLGLNITDTQTGLRGIPFNKIIDFLEVKGDRYEYEMNMIVECKNKGLPIEEVSIKTIYLNENESSHFNPIVDSIKIYSVFLKFLTSSLLSFGVDIILFMIFSSLLKGIYPVKFILIATIAARVLSSLFNFSLNKNVVFKSKSKNSIVKYYILSLLQMLASAILVYSVFNLFRNAEVAIKIVIDSILFLISYVIQREWVFKKAKTRGRGILND